MEFPKAFTSKVAGLKTKLESTVKEGNIGENLKRAIVESNVGERLKTAMVDGVIPENLKKAVTENTVTEALSKTVQENRIVETLKTKAQEISLEEVLNATMTLPIAKVERDVFLRKELQTRYPSETVELAIQYNPAYAGIARDEIDNMAKTVINYETNKVSAVSFAAGIPGGIALIGTIPADITQYFIFILRTMQKLAYLYGFDDFEMREDHIDDGTMNEVLIFLGAMFGVQEANAAVKAVASVATRGVATRLARKALTKGTIYPIVKKIATQIGAKMTKQVFANGVSKIVPLVGGFITGGLTYATFKPCANNLRNTLRKLPLSDPATYDNERHKYDNVQDLQEVKYVENEDEVLEMFDTMVETELDKVDENNDVDEENRENTTDDKTDMNDTNKEVIVITPPPADSN